MSSKKPYFPNNIDGVMQTQYEPVDADIVFDNSDLWEIPSSVACIIRAQHRKTGKVEEYSYQKPIHAKNRMEKLLVNGEYDVLLADEDTIHFLTPTFIHDEDD